VKVVIRELDPACDDEVVLVASRMRATLVEVLGKTRGEDMYSMAWLQERVRSHLGPGSNGNVFLACQRGEVVGHTIVRLEQDDGETYGLFSTVYVAPGHRRNHIAGSLLQHGEGWMRGRGLKRAATNTAQTNDKLIGLFEKHGYAITLRVDEMVHLSRSL